MLVALLLSLPSWAQREIRLQQFSIENGLSQNTINTIYQDSRGYMWFGTQNGLNKFDGRNFTVYKNTSGDTTSLSNNDVYAIFEDHEKQLWIGTRSGLSRYNRSRNTFSNYDYPEGRVYAMRPVWCIAPADDDHLWIGASGGLFKFDKGLRKFEHFKINDSIQNANSAKAICRDRAGVLWIGTQIGELMQFNPNTHQFSKVHFPQEGTVNYAIASIVEDSEGMIWIGRDDGSIYRYDITTRSFKEYTFLKKKYPIRTMIEDKEGNLWVGTDKGGAFLLDPNSGRVSSLGQRKENETDVVLSLFNDAKGDMWLGTYHGGVYLFDKMDTTFQQYAPQDKQENASQSNSVLSIFQDDESLWLGSDGGGLLQRRNGTVKRFLQNTTANSIAGNTILCLEAGFDSELYIGTYADGMSVLDRRTGKFKTYNQRNGLSDNSVWVIYNDVDHVWIGTNKGGVNVLDKRTGKIVHFTNVMQDERTISSNTIRAIFKDSRGKFWIGTVSGLNVFNETDSTFTAYYYRDSSNTISNNNVLCIFEDMKKNLWFGTHGGGVNRYDARSNTFTSFQEKDGLAGNIVYAMLEDAQGNLWMSTNKGLSRFDVVNQVFKNFDTRSGLSSAQFNIGAAFKGKEGQMFFGNINGVTSFFPHHIRQNAFIPPVVISDFKLFNKPVLLGDDSPLQETIDVAKEVTLEHSQSVFSLHFAALNFSHADKNSYAYMLEGFDQDWIAAGNNTTATYTNLDPGEYVFKVRGSNNDNVWNEQATTLKVIVKPPLWKTWWARTLFVLMVAAGLYMAYRFKINAIKKQQELLTLLVDQRTAEIEEKNKLILETEKRNAQLVHQKLNDELATKSKELTNYTLLIVQKNKLLDELKKKLKDVVRNPGSSNLRDFRNLVQMINYNFSPEKEWKEFNANFNRIHKGFTDTLKEKFPELTSNDLRLCALYRIDIPTKDIAEAMGISQTSVKMARYRLRKKLNLSPEEDIHDFLKRC
ncbi:two-component regulator propeller domain-containing protein [Pseudochryseolinea flava]|uniref:HTH luxR-type domain-containing protein n=1 Tax=Pseudochryseolinea flava TaxID=2059302 RepID=A0A364Y1K0_9BACT|nr:two-component regulator propeller domain-containing protein [Pseudochryseolinea flava]RAW00608.1 hypothetical protein DQQ10_13525 [Pseudochryseolinea flava]